MRTKRRYLVFEVTSTVPIENFEELRDSVRGSILRLIGEMGTGKSEMKVMKEKWNPDTQRGVIMISHTHIEEIKTSLSLIESIGDVKASIRSIYTSGLLNKTESYLKKK